MTLGPGSVSSLMRMKELCDKQLKSAAADGRDTKILNYTRESIDAQLLALRNESAIELTLDVGNRAAKLAKLPEDQLSREVEHFYPAAGATDSGAYLEVASRGGSPTMDAQAGYLDEDEFEDPIDAWWG